MGAWGKNSNLFFDLHLYLYSPILINPCGSIHTTISLRVLPNFDYNKDIILKLWTNELLTCLYSCLSDLIHSIADEFVNSRGSCRLNFCNGLENKIIQMHVQSSCCGELEECEGMKVVDIIVRDDLTKGFDHSNSLCSTRNEILPASD